MQVAQALHAAGRAVTALDLVRAVGINEVKMPIAAKEVKPKYVREKVRNAFIHVVVDVSPEQQKRILQEFRNHALAKEPWLPALDEAHLLQIALPGKVVVYAYRVPLSKYQGSSLPETVRTSNILQAYTRKPRVDAQHHVQAQEK